MSYITGKLKIEDFEHNSPGWAEGLAAAASVYDGHVTNGSFVAMIRYVEELIAHEIKNFQEQALGTTLGDVDARVEKKYFTE